MKRICFALMFLTVFVAGCASTPKTLSIENSQNKVWPAPPDKARFEYVGQITGEDNFKSEKKNRFTLGKFFNWVVGGLFGKQKPNVLQRPQAGVIDAQGRIYVSDVSRQAVYVFDSVAGRLHVWENSGARQKFKSPIGLALFANGLYVADSELGYVSILNIENGEPMGKISESLVRPTGVAIDPRRQQLYVADTRDHKVKIFSLDGKLKGSFGEYGAKQGQLNGPTYITFSQDRIYVSDTLNARIQIFDYTGKFIRAFGNRGRRLGDFSRPKGIAVTNSGLLYVVESFYDHLLVYDQKGRFLLPIGGEGNGVGQFYLPSGVWTGPNSQVYIADMFNGRIVILRYLEGA